MLVWPELQKWISSQQICRRRSVCSLWRKTRRWFEKISVYKRSEAVHVNNYHQMLDAKGVSKFKFIVGKLKRVERKWLCNRRRKSSLPQTLDWHLKKLELSSSKMLQQTKVAWHLRLWKSWPRWHWTYVNWWLKFWPPKDGEFTKHMQVLDPNNIPKFYKEYVEEVQNRFVKSRF